jgi:hypothetical protein
MRRRKPEHTTAQQKPDYRGLPTHVCPCGCFIIKVSCVFEEGSVVFYLLDAECYECGALLTAPTPIDDDYADI